VAYQEKFMQQAICEARLAQDKGDIPVGCVIVKGENIIATGHNLREAKQNALCHAEIVAIHRACEALNRWRLSDCDLYVTLEPCPMCAGAIAQARMKTLYFGAFDSLGGAFCQGMYEIVEKQTAVFGGICEEECQNLLSGFFREIRA
jgi:tRNA(adenine34) deaminase